MEEFTDLETGGSVGSLRGKFYEYYLIKLFAKHGLSIKEKIEKDCSSPNTYFFRYRTPPDQITEIDFYFPCQKVGFWITCLGKIEKIRCKNCKTKKYNEFKSLRGICPHCKKSRLPLASISGFSRWICQNCKKIVDPFELEDKICECGGKEFENYTDKGASSQAHKQAYYRIAEYIESKTGGIDDLISTEIIFNKKYEWRVWADVIEKFFDATLFVFENNPGLLDSEGFNNEIWKFVENSLKRTYATGSFSNYFIKYFKKIREDKNKKYGDWITKLIQRRAKLWKDEYPAAFPIRYSIFTLLREMGTRKFVNPYEIGVLSNYDTDKTINSARMKKAEVNCIKKGYIKDDKVTPAGIKEIKLARDKYLEVIKFGVEFDGKTHTKDIWLNTKHNDVIFVLKEILDLSIKNGWYKYAMVANRDSQELSDTPFINEQFEPLEMLTKIYLEKFKKMKIIDSFEGLEGNDVFEPTFLREIFHKTAESNAFILGEDAKILLPNGKKIYLQCKSNTSFKKWIKNFDISGSGISYKDAKRMIAHNLISSFKIKDGKIIKEDNHYYIALLDGDWASEKNDLFRLIRTMYILGVDEIFFADEIDTAFKDLLIELGKTKK